MNRKAFLNALLNPFGRKIVTVRFFGWHSQRLIGDGNWHIGKLEWPDEMSNMDYFVRKNNAAVFEEKK